MSDPRPFAGAVRRRIRPIGALTAVTALAGAGLLTAVHFAREDDRAAAEADPLPAASSPAPTNPAVTTSPQAGSPTAAGVGAGDGVRSAAAPISLRYTFDGGPSVPVTDAAGRFPMRIVTEAGGALNFASVPAAPPVDAGPAAPPADAGPAAPRADAGPAAPRAGGFAIQFPPRCDVEPKSCPRTILEGTRDDALNPGTRPLQYGASVLISPADTGDGANVMQKGYSVGGGSQFKLQVDHETAYPSCVIAHRSKIFRIEPRISMADSRWHTIVCTRSGTRLGITVDGVAKGSVFVPPSLSIANAEPLRIGGKGANARNDQFAGQLDNVFLTIS